MRKLMLVAGLAVAALVPSLAFAQPSCGEQRDNQIGATIAGGALGAVAGSAVAPRGDRTAGAVVGGLGGAVIGNQIGRPNADCAHAYGYYDRDGRWHASDVAQANARGYYDRDGAWVEGAPNGYYDSQRRFVPASVDGYYDNDGQWVTSVSGHYDDEGRWIAGQTTGAYDANGHWAPGARSGHADANGVWISDAQPGYYDSNHRWRAGPSQGYYDSRGVWISSAASVASYGVNASYAGVRERHDEDSREAFLERRIRSSSRNGDLSGYDAARDIDTLNSIRHQEISMRDGAGEISQRDERRLQSRLDELTASLNASLDDAGS
ncbi:MAG TPA: glycine zipper 2TM domain-containing protein [Caulobacteraceae bacterium]|nr:glycine zipper 2TM domain-containing protein [Caulobacteraceae bacterium]